MGLQRLMPLMDFTLDGSLKGQQFDADDRPCSDGNWTHRTWSWEIPRSGAENYIVRLCMYQKVELVSVKMGLALYEKNCSSPNLVRVAIISCPTKDRHGEDTNERLDTALQGQINDAIKRVERKGVCPVCKSDDPMFREYFAD